MSPSLDGVRQLSAELQAKAHRFRDSLLLMFLVALALRLIVAGFVYPEHLNPRRDHFPFGYEIGRIARSIAIGEGFANPLFGQTGPTAWMTPVYPYLLAGVFRLFGIYTAASDFAILSLNSLFSALTCLLVFFMAKRSFGPTVAAWAGWTWALFPFAVQTSVEWIWENTLTCLLLSVLFVMAQRLEYPARLWVWVGFGLLWGLATLTNPVVLSTLPFLGGWVCYRLHLQGRRWALPAAAAGLALLVTVTPWTVRNYRTFHQLIPFRDTLWLAARVGNTGDTSSYWSLWAHPSANDEEMNEFRRVGELAYMAEKRRQVLDFLHDHPALFLWLSFRRFVYMWTGYWSLGRSYLAEEPLDPFNILVATTLVALTLWGFRRAFRERRREAIPYALVLLSFPLIYYVTQPSMRYRHPIDPQMVVLAVYAVAGWLDGPNRVTREGTR